MTSAFRLSSVVAALAAGGLALVLYGCGGSNSGKKPLVADSEMPKSEDEDGGFGGAFSGTETGDSGVPGTGGATGEAQGNEEGAQTLLKQFVNPGADHAALTRSLRPTSADYKSLFDAPTATKIETAQAKDWDSGKAIIKPGPNQTEVKIWSATGADILAGKGNAKEFPNGYKKVAKHLAAGVMFFRFKFVETGKETGTAYDGLAFVNGHWVIAPQPWKALGGGGDDTGDAPPKKKGGKKKKKTT